MGLFFKKSSIYNVRMVITEEKILSNIEKIKRLIDPDSKKQIIKLEDDVYFKDLVESVTTYLINYPNKDEFPFNVYKTAYDLVEFTTNQFEENNKKIAGLIELREENIKQSYLLQDALATVVEKKAGWIDKVQNFEGKFSVDIAEALTILANSSIKEPKDVENAKKMVETKIKNLESNLFIEVDLDRIEDSSKALSFIGIEIAEALKTIPIPGDGDSKKKIENNGGIFSFFKKHEKNDSKEKEEIQNINQNQNTNQNINLNNEINNLETKDLNQNINTNNKENLAQYEYENLNKEFTIQNGVLTGKNLEESTNMFGFEIVNLGDNLHQVENIEDFSNKTNMDGHLYENMMLENNSLNNEFEMNHNLNYIENSNGGFNSYYNEEIHTNYELNNETFDFNSLNNDFVEIANFNQIPNNGNNNYGYVPNGIDNSFYNETRKEVELSFFQKIINNLKKTKIAKWIYYLFNVQVVLDYPEYPMDIK